MFTVVMPKDGVRWLETPSSWHGHLESLRAGPLPAPDEIGFVKDLAPLVPRLGCESRSKISMVLSHVLIARL